MVLIGCCFKLQMSLKGDTKAFGAFTYDSMGKKLRFRSNESHPANTSMGLDLLMLFNDVGDFSLQIKMQKEQITCCFAT